MKQLTDNIHRSTAEYLALSIDQFKISYSASFHRLRIEFPLKLCIQEASPPELLISKATAKLEQERSQGLIAFYKVYAEQLKCLWDSARRDYQIAQKYQRDSVLFTLGLGAPLIPGLKVLQSAQSGIHYEIRFDGDNGQMKQFRFDDLRLNVEQQLTELNISGLGNQAQLFAFWLRHVRGEGVKSEQIALAPVVKVEKHKNFSLVANKSRNEMYLMILRRELFYDKREISLMLRQVELAVNKYRSSQQVDIHYLKDELVERLKYALRGPEFFGMNYPLTYLAALDYNSAVAVAPKEENLEVHDTRPAGQVRLNIDIADDHMSAYVGDFETYLYDDTSSPIDLAWIKSEMLAKGIVFNSEPSIDDMLVQMIERKQSLQGALLAKGRPMVAPKDPYLHEVYKDSKVDENSNEVVDMREMQQRDVVRSNDKVAEVRYRQPAVDRKNIFGLVEKAPPGDSLAVEVGEGIRQVGNEFFATMDGRPKIEGVHIQVDKIMVHSGDVNFKTGNLRFTGSVEIEGSIDSGSVVDIKGDLVVNGTIRDAFVRVTGKLDAKSGIVTGDKGRLFVRGDIDADFIENSHVICQGNVTVRKAILNSTIIASGLIKAPAEGGVMGGGLLCSLAGIETGKLGFGSGAITHVQVGIDYKSKVRANIRRARYERVLAGMQETRNAARELTKRKDGHKTKRHESVQAEVYDRLNRYKSLVDRLKEQMDSAVAKVKYDKDAKIVVFGNLSPNCVIEVADNQIHVAHEVVAVEVSARKTRGTHIHPIESDKENAASDQQKAAS